MLNKEAVAELNRSVGKKKRGMKYIISRLLVKQKGNETTQGIMCTGGEEIFLRELWGEWSSYPDLASMRVFRPRSAGVY